jgi:hypothetical protein
LGSLISAQTPKTATAAKGTATVTLAKGTFDVKMAPLTADAIAAEAGLAAYTIDKVWHGDIEGTSKGQMTATQLEGEAGLYIALEKVTATIGGRRGTFVFEHRGYMAKGVQELSIRIVPGSGTGELAGISGKLEVKIEDKKHFYEVEYSLPAKP